MATLPIRGGAPGTTPILQPGRYGLNTPARLTATITDTAAGAYTPAPVGHPARIDTREHPTAAIRATSTPHAQIDSATTAAEPVTARASSNARILTGATVGAQIRGGATRP